MRRFTLSLSIIITIIISTLYNPITLKASDNTILSYISDIYVDESLGIFCDYGEDSYYEYDWIAMGRLNATINNKEYYSITLPQLEELLLEIDPNAFILYNSDYYQSYENPWNVGESFIMNFTCDFSDDTSFRKEINVNLCECDIKSITADSLTYTFHTYLDSPTYNITYNDNTTTYGLKLDRYVTYEFESDTWPSTPGKHSVMATLNEQFQIPINVNVNEPLSSGKIGDNITWEYCQDTETLTLSGTGVCYDGLNHELPHAWKQHVSYYNPKHIVIEDGIEEIFTGIFETAHNAEDITFPSSLRFLPDLVITSHSLTTVTLPEGMQSFASNSFYGCTNLSEYNLPSTLRAIDLDALCAVYRARSDMNLEPLKSTIIFSGTQKQWDDIRFVEGGRGMSNCYTDEEMNAIYETYTINCIGQEDVVVEEGTADIPYDIVDKADSDKVQIDISDIDDINSVTIKPGVINSIKDAVESDEASVEIKFKDAVVIFDSTAFKTITEDTYNEPISLQAALGTKDNLSTKQQAALGTNKAHAVISLEAMSGNDKISDFNGGVVKVSIPFEIPNGKSSSDFAVYYIDSNGVMTKMNTKYENNHIVFETTHFSDYVLLDTTNGPGDNTNLYIYISLMLISLTIIIICIKKRQTILN